MKKLLFVLLILLSACTAPPFEISEQLSLTSPAALIIEGVPPASLSLDWAPEPIEAFILSQNADGFTGGEDYQVVAVGRLISKRVEGYISNFSRLDQKSADHVIVTIEDARLNYKYGLNKLSYAKLLINAEIAINGESHRKVYFRQVDDQSDLSESTMLELVFDDVSIEIGQDILTTLAK